MPIQINVPQESLELARRFKQAPERITKAIMGAMDDQNQLTIGYAQQHKLHQKGPDTLQVRTARLWQSLRILKAAYYGTQIISGIGSNVVYAGVHEFGFNGNVTVKSFLRKNPRGDRFRVGTGEANRKFSIKALSKSQLRVAQIASGVSSVRSFTRHMKMPARAYILRSIEERQALYSQALGTAVVKTMSGGEA